MTYLSKCAVFLTLVSPFSIASEVLKELSLCAKENDSLQRLVCYDKLTDKMKGNQANPPNVQFQTSVQVATIESVEIEDNVSILAQEIQPDPILADPEQSNKVHISHPKPAVDAATRVSQQQANFGQENKQSTQDLVNQIQATIVKVKKGRYGNQTITLDNGQVWLQTDGSGLRFAKGHQVFVKRGVLGSFFIGRENVNRRLRAKRVK